MSMLRRVRAIPSMLIAASIAMGTVVSPADGEISRMFAFGDSLSDTGNVFIATGGAIPAPPYFEGRFSNGPVWVEQLAARLGIDPPGPFLDGGTNYAWGGAESGPGFTFGVIPNTDEQIIDYLGSGGEPQSDDLFVLFAGANNFISGEETDPSVVVDDLIGNITTLVDAGAEQVLVSNYLPLGLTPGALGTPDEEPLNQITMQFNELYFDALDELEQSIDAMIYRLDLFDLAMDVYDDPAAFGFVNVTDPAYDAETGEIVDNPDEYLFWDHLHPTAAAHDLLAERAFLAIPAPAAGVALLAGLIMSRQRRRVERTLDQ
jgi:phospholipase/lecithinase/hemolysin